MANNAGTGKKGREDATPPEDGTREGEVATPPTAEPAAREGAMAPKLRPREN